MTNKSFIFTIVFVLLCGVSNVFSQGWEYQLQHDSDNERFYFYDAEELSDGNIGVASHFYYKSGFGDFYSAHPAVALISSDGHELARSSFFRPGYTSCRMLLIFLKMMENFLPSPHIVQNMIP